MRIDAGSTAPDSRRIVGFGADVLLLAGVIVCVPLGVLAIGIPIALFVNALLWIGRLL